MQEDVEMGQGSGEGHRRGVAVVWQLCDYLLLKSPIFHFLKVSVKINTSRADFQVRELIFIASVMNRSSF